MLPKPELSGIVIHSGVTHDRLLDRLQRLRQAGADQLRIGLVGDDKEFAIDEAIRTGRIARTGGPA